MEIIKGVREIDHSEGQMSLISWMLVCGEGVVLVDGGMREPSVDKIGAELASAGKGWRDVRLILVTHKHGDHVKNLPRLAELTGAPVKAHSLEAPLIQQATMIPISGINSGEVLPYCGGVEVIHVPGHSEGNACYLLKGSRTLIAGDTVFCDEKGALSEPPERYCLDAKQAKKNLDILLRYDFENLLYSHGPKIIGGAKSKVEELVARTR
jgi:glyoxylase-like metal-dependent hydrolase (beta-lactamase superfamily II)